MYYNTSEWQLKEKNRNQLKNLVLVYLMGSYNFIFSHWSWSFEHHIQIWHAYHIFISEFHDVKIRISLNCSKVSLSIAALNQAMYKNRVENILANSLHFFFTAMKRWKFWNHCNECDEFAMKKKTFFKWKIC